jgi:hypothetical protein
MCHLQPKGRPPWTAARNPDRIDVLTILARDRGGGLGCLRLPRGRRWRPPARSVHHPSVPAALETSGSVGTGTGWQPRHLVARAEGRGDRRAPLYAKGHSQGEYIFDHNWAHAYERAGGRYYPKLQIAVPFTPARAAVPDPARAGGDGASRAGAGRGATGRRQPAVVAARHLLHRGRGARRASHGPDARATSSSTGKTAATPISTGSSPTCQSRKRKNIRKERAHGAGLRRRDRA